MRRRSGNRPVRQAVTAAGLLLTAACAAQPVRMTTAEVPTTEPAAPAATAAVGPVCSAFELQLAAGISGQRTPVEAARWLAGHGAAGDVPLDGWQDAGRDEAGAVVRSGKWTLHVVQVPDRTWRVDSGRSSC